MNQTIKKVQDNGKLVELSDSSKWEVNSMHQTTSSFWMAGNRIAIVNSEDILHPSVLVNVGRVECVLAKSKSA